MKPSRSKDKPVKRSKTTEDDPGQAVGAAPEAPLAPEERAQLLVELEAEFEAAERSIEDEGTINADEFLKQRAEYWAGLAHDTGRRNGRMSRRRGR